MGPEMSSSGWLPVGTTGLPRDRSVDRRGGAHGAVTLHYDADFEHIAATTGQAHAWIAPRGTLR
jgi:hypothetical protein